MTDSNVVPFGKHKGQPVEVLLADSGYRDWVLAQPWFRDRYPTIYQTVINYGGEPVDTPEHNEMQAGFLDDARCLRLARLLYPNRRFDRDAAGEMFDRHPDAVELARRYASRISTSFEPEHPVGRRFEDEGWDVTYGVNPAAMTIDVGSLPECTCGPCDHSRCSAKSVCRGGDRDYGWCDHYNHGNRAVAFESRPDASLVTAHCFEDCPWHNARLDGPLWLLGEPEGPGSGRYGEPYSAGRWFRPDWTGTIRVELKPELGDDFPTVLRQVLRYPHEGYSDRRCVVARRHDFAKVTWEQVTSMFAASNITLLAESDLDPKERP